MIDTHCHLGDPKFDHDRGEVVERARVAGVSHIVIVADSGPSTKQAIELAQAHGLSATAGVHPHEASSWTPEVSAQVETALDDPVVVAVGETGLDYHYNHSPPKDQRRAFAAQLQLGARYGLPVVVHSRSADEDTAAMLRDTDATYILHSFSAGRPVLQVALDAGAYVSFSGMVTFRSWTDRDAVQAVTATRLLIETDAPYLAPVPNRGKRNEPAFVSYVAGKIAEFRNESAEEITEQTTANAVRCFGSRVTLTHSGEI
jgi:TatD DNase family protein